jgi:Up-regulated During Septation
MHYVVETALADSLECTILSFEEVDDLKKEFTLLTNRIEVTKRKLALESKVRDAALSLSRLYSRKGKGDRDSNEGPGHRARRSLLGGNSQDKMLYKSEDELSSSTRKCDELAEELWRLNNRAVDTQRRILQHGMGILGLTHQAALKKGGYSPGRGQQTGRPGSDASGFSRSNGSTLSPPMEASELFDDKHLYKTPERLDEYSNEYKGGQRSLSPEKRSSGRPTSGDFELHAQAVIQTGQKLEDLNGRLRELIIEANPRRNQNYITPPKYQINSLASHPESSLQSQMDYLEQGLTIMNQTGNDGISEAEEKLERLNTRLRNMIVESNQALNSYKSPPRSTGETLEPQIDFLAQTLEVFDEQRHSERLLLEKSTGRSGQTEQYETVLLGLWEIIQAGEEERSLRKHQQRQARGELVLEEDEDFSPDESIPGESFSLPSFSNKVQRLYAMSTSLREQKSILRNQIKQQRELNQKGTKVKETDDAKLLQLEKELLDADRETARAREELTVVMKRLNESRRESALRNNEESVTLTKEREMRTGLEQQVLQLQNELGDSSRERSLVDAEHQLRHEKNEVKISNLEAEFASLVAAKEKLENSERSTRDIADEKSGQSQKLEKEIRELEGQVVQLTTDLTMTRAELDSAYGSRSQRAADVAANPDIKRQLEELEVLRKEKDAGGGNGEKLNLLKKELSETIGEYEVLTKQSVEFERERDQMENQIDSLRDRCENLEAQLNEEKVRMLGVKSPGGTNESTSTTVLKNEFKKMMRDTRTENMKALRVSCSMHWRICASFTDTFA